MIMGASGELLTFAAIMALGQFSPGPDMLLLTRTALKSGARSGVEMAWGIACGLMVHATLAVAGVALAFDRFPTAREALRWLAAGYLVWLAYSISREIFFAKDSGAKVDTPPEAAVRRPFLRGFLCNLLNPKAALFLAAVCAPFLRGERPAGWPIVLWLIVVLQSGVLWSLWTIFLQWNPLRRGYEKFAKWIDAAFAVGLIGLAVRLAIG